MELGAFAVSLTVKDLETSKAFYEKLGFSVFGGDASQNWQILKNGSTTISLFQGMFVKNMLTFNPGWDGNAETLADFTDVRELQRELKAQDMEMAAEADESTTGPAHLMVIAPDGNPISSSTSTFDPSVLARCRHETTSATNARRSPMRGRAESIVAEQTN